jgi:hypothetical protein
MLHYDDFNHDERKVILWLRNEEINYNQLKKEIKRGIIYYDNYLYGYYYNGTWIKEDIDFNNIDFDKITALLIEDMKEEEQS